MARGLIQVFELAVRRVYAKCIHHSIDWFPSVSAPLKRAPIPLQSSNLPGNREGSAAGPGARPYGDVSSPGGDDNREPSMSDYLHFGRLIGERPEAVQEQLQATSIAVDRDEEAESYMEK